MSKRVLVVDDTTSVARFIESALKTLQLNLSVMSVLSGEEALLAVAVDTPDLMIVDMNLPGMSGIDLIKIYRKRNPNAAVILTTGMSDYPLAREAREINADGHFFKPIDLGPFLDTVRRCLTGTREEQTEETVKDQINFRGFSRAVVQLHEVLNALGVMIIDDTGKPIVQAGEAPSHVFEQSWVTPVMGVLNAGNSFSRVMSSSTINQVMLFRSQEKNFLLAPIGRYAMIVVLQSDSRVWRLSMAMEEMLRVQNMLNESIEKHEAYRAVTVPLQMPQSMLEETPAAVSELPAQAAAEGQEAALDARTFNALLEQLSGAEEDAEAFWDQAAQEEGTPSASPGILSFEQAQQLGLTPDKGKKKD
ncbi:MAG: response regulator [Anaerolineaceae bacterium]|nr:response regulator [Anaerolineaceae bacterium]